MKVLDNSTVEILNREHITIFHTFYSTTELLLSRAGAFRILCAEVSRTKLLLRNTTGECYTSSNDGSISLWLHPDRGWWLSSTSGPPCQAKGHRGVDVHSVRHDVLL